MPRIKKNRNEQLKKKMINIKTEQQDHEDLHQIADDLGTSASSLMRMLLKQRIAAVKKDGWDPQKFIPKE